MQKAKNKEHEQVAIITLIDNFNYGNRLQNYATTFIFEKMHFRVETLIIQRLLNTRKIKLLIKEILGLYTDREKDYKKTERYKLFEQFNKNIKFRYLNHASKNLNDDYDYFVIGSDQVWNPNYIVDLRTAFLSFVENDKKITVSPSIGVSQVNRYVGYFKNGLRNIPHLSVREEKGAQIINTLIQKEAVVTVDPTLMLTTKEWDKVSNNQCVPNKPYIFAYILGNKTSNQREFLDKIAREKNARLVEISDRNKLGEIPVGPSEFISLIKNARHVITDSYHGAIFSCLYNIPLTIFIRDGSSDIISRIETLADTFNLHSKIFGSPSFEYNEAAKFEYFNRVLPKERKKFIDHLKLTLGQRAYLITSK